MEEHYKLENLECAVSTLDEK